MYYYTSEKKADTAFPQMHKHLVILQEQPALHSTDVFCCIMVDKLSVLMLVENNTDTSLQILYKIAEKYYLLPLWAPEFVPSSLFSNPTMRAKLYSWKANKISQLRLRLLHIQLLSHVFLLVLRPYK